MRREELRSKSRLHEATGWRSGDGVVQVGNNNDDNKDVNIANNVRLGVRLTCHKSLYGNESRRPVTDTIQSDVKARVFEQTDGRMNGRTSGDRSDAVRCDGPLTATWRFECVSQSINQWTFLSTNHLRPTCVVNERDPNTNPVYTPHTLYMRITTRNHTNTSTIISNCNYLEIRTMHFRSLLFIFRSSLPLSVETSSSWRHICIY